MLEIQRWNLKLVPRVCARDHPWVNRLKKLERPRRRSNDSKKWASESQSTWIAIKSWCLTATTTSWRLSSNLQNWVWQAMHASLCSESVLKDHYALIKYSETSIVDGLLFCTHDKSQRKQLEGDAYYMVTRCGLGGSLGFGHVRSGACGIELFAGMVRDDP